ncbi:MAG: diacylglycerol kinase family lipid kinase [Candidatus Cloacimonetes bacterium]|nr:diacylglycerol kinase family lipid kinase [Candidatus Cloacimonadota bacterium]MCF7813989.1 diacylglycerol kinase family lipid kinase [Candidatus Cloacimonadota bacterium]MCF7868617.1 diacylglycerol kinase family lipid kinase [Candidatus Cloacimonadota bacterium]MCF7882846.1 diacylglycerol kinase family lipid kinase [Candidatus Cloacimonadota bacterium]
MKILLIFNPFAGHGRAKKILPQVEAEFQKHNIKFELHLTDYPEHGIEIVKDANFKKYDGIVAAGGDGTLFEVINGYYQNKTRKKIPIGVLPVGTGNAFARDLELHVSRWKEAIKIISQNKTRKVDVGKFTTHGQTYYFLNILGLGFVADVTKTAHKLKALGNLSYTLGVFYHILLLKSCKLKIELDGEVLDRQNIFVEISNTTYTSNFYMAPSAEIDDGFLDVTLLGKMGKIGLLKAFPKVFTGEHVKLPKVETFKVKKIKIETEKAKVLTPDGELIGITPVEVECLHQAIEVFWK